MMEKSSSPSLREEKAFDTASTTGDNTAITTPDNGEAELVYPTGLPFWLIVLSLCLAVFVLALGIHFDSIYLLRKANN